MDTKVLAERLYCISTTLEMENIVMEVILELSSMGMEALTVMEVILELSSMGIEVLTGKQSFTIIVGEARTITIKVKDTMDNHRSNALLRRHGVEGILTRKQMIALKHSQN
jgi:ribosome maturation factor RimP